MGRDLHWSQHPERSAWVGVWHPSNLLAAVTLPVTAIASVYGMNVIVNQHTHVPQLILVVLVMLAISGMLLRWARKQGWW